MFPVSVSDLAEANKTNVCSAVRSNANAIYSLLLCRPTVTACTFFVAHWHREYHKERDKSGPLHAMAEHPLLCVTCLPELIGFYNSHSRRFYGHVLTPHSCIIDNNMKTICSDTAYTGQTSSSRTTNSPVLRILLLFFFIIVPRREYGWTNTQSSLGGSDTRRTSS